MSSRSRSGGGGLGGGVKNLVIGPTSESDFRHTNNYFRGGNDIFTGASQGLQRYGNYFQTDREQGGGRNTDQWGTGFSKMSHGNVKIDPSIRAIQEQNLARNNNLYNELGASGQTLWDNLSSTRQRYIDNGGAFSDAYVRPLQEQITAGRGELQRSNSLRGLSGSTFGDQSLQTYDMRGQTALGDARAKAEQANLEAITGIDSQMANTLFSRVAQQAAISGQDAATAQQRLVGELSAMGLGLQQQQLMIKAFEDWQSRAEKNRSDMAGGILKSFTGS